MRRLSNPVVLETHAGYGAIWKRCYTEIPAGVAMEKDGAKASHLAIQRPMWAVYMCNSEAALAEGVGSHLQINFVDFDPYGDPWPIIDAFFAGHKPTVSPLVIAVNDGLRQKVQRGGAYNAESLAKAVARFGNRIYPKYLEICEFLLEEKATAAGYSLQNFAGYYADDGMTHYAGVLLKAT